MATSDGSLHMGDIDPREGGDCKYHREFRLVGGEDVVSNHFDHFILYKSLYLTSHAH